MVIITSSQMREKTENGLKNKAKETLEALLPELEKSAADGKYELFYRGTLNQEAVDTLRRAGYKVKYTSGEFDDLGNYYQGFFYINWKEKKSLKTKIKNLFCRGY